ncbi:imidazole glycerol phosphate synthase subunit HisF [Mucilaginibacter sp. MD40]|uniref:imidazole glycerol phosphate synthase subunit HisF n=1 Tax=Mucilaginibacter sp. MD40 TaxID=2029590 RepID=UPI000BAC704F|nr:imidazole glycerol phosphate synthase subunit HisF [Mucilaginibacter sp. MD40]
MSKKFFLGAGPEIFEYAKGLRYNMTAAETTLWGHIKGNQLGVRFRRQHPLGIYIADFYCHQHKLVIELDGGIHLNPEIAAHDIERQKGLETDGMKVLRFTNNEIFTQLEKVLTTIQKALSSPFRGRGGLTKRIIPCLDVKDGRTVKGVNFVDLRDAGDPVELAWNYSQQGADELVFLDITATVERRKTMVELVKAVARQINIPFTIGGGINEIADADALLNAGADKISINSAAVRNPALINELAKAFGVQFVIVAVDTRVLDGKNIVHLNGGRLPTEKQTLDWILEAESRGAGEILLTSMDHDGTKGGFDNGLLKQVNDAVNIPVIASGGAGAVEHFVDVFHKTNVDAALAASVFHYGEILIPDLKAILKDNNIEVRV